jgi:hypothetical protein
MCVKAVDNCDFARNMNNRIFPFIPAVLSRLFKKSADFIQTLFHRLAEFTASVLGLMDR